MLISTSWMYHQVRKTVCSLCYQKMVKWTLLTGVSECNAPDHSQCARVIGIQCVCNILYIPCTNVYTTTLIYNAGYVLTMYVYMHTYVPIYTMLICLNYFQRLLPPSSLHCPSGVQTIARLMLGPLTAHTFTL